MRWLDADTLQVPNLKALDGRPTAQSVIGPYRHGKEAVFTGRNEPGLTTRRSDTNVVNHMGRLAKAQSTVANNLCTPVRIEGRPDCIGESMLRVCVVHPQPELQAEQ